jgi:HK97 family phage prohead protease
MKTKQVSVDVKAVGDAGRFSAYAAVFDNVDSHGDVIVKGAFAEWLGGTAGGADVAVYWGHRMDDPFLNIGATVSAVEDDRGLLVDVQLDLDSASGAQVFKLLAEKRVRQMSFAFDVLEAGWVDRVEAEGGSFYELRKLFVHEVSVVPVGANRETEILTVKSALGAVEDGLKSGKALPESDRVELVAAVKSLTAALGEVQNETESNDEANDEEPETVKSEEPSAVAAGFALAKNQLIQSL